MPRATRAPPPGSDLDLGDAERFERAQRVARDDAADAEALGDILFAADDIAGLEALFVQRLAHLSDDLRREGGGAARGRHAPLTVLAAE